MIYMWSVNNRQVVWGQCLDTKTLRGMWICTFRKQVRILGGQEICTDVSTK